jgi:hypothetical protein
MKINWILTHALFLVVCCVLLASNAVGQTSTNATDQTSMYSGMPTNLAAKMAKIEEKRAEWSRLHPEQEAEEIALMSNAAIHWEDPKPWPKTAKNKKIIEHCIEQLRSAIDTNEIELACSKLTNQPEKVLTIKKLAEETVSNLNFLATMLTSSDLSDITRGDDGWSAEMDSQKYYYYVDFWSPNGEPSSIRSIMLSPHEAKGLSLRARFYENGKLSSCMRNSPPRKNQIGFNEDGHLDFYSMRIPPKNPLN